MLEIGTLVDLNDHDISLTLERTRGLGTAGLAGWTVRQPSVRARRWSVVSGLVHGLVWAFPFVMSALVWQRASGNGTGPAMVFAIGMVLVLVFLIRGIVVPRTWWFAYTDREAIVEHGLIDRTRDHLVFDRVQYLERRAGPIMRTLGLSSLVFDTAAGRATIPAVPADDVAAIEERVRIAMQRAAVL